MQQRNNLKLDQFIKEDRFELESYVSTLIKQHTKNAPSRSEEM
ncbi:MULTISPECIES: hypothetical protein [Sediminibacillus]|nr:hypothetical protein [Sediminibacillus terrae]